jgi:hypothetical protein
MEREIIVTEYQKLRDYLNRANKLSNQKSELTFKIEQTNLLSYHLFAVIESNHESHKLALAERTRIRVWERTGYSPFKNLEEFCAATLNLFQANFVLSKSLYLTKEIIFEFETEINLKLNSLLLNKLYEP